MAKAGVIEIDLQASTARFQKDMLKATNALNSNVNQMNAKLGALEKGFTAVKAAALGVQAGIALMIGSAAFSTVNNLIKKYGEAEKSLSALNSTLKNTGRFSDEASQQIQKNAVAIQRLTQFGDDALVQVSATIGQFAKKLNIDELAQTQKAAAGLATVLKVDLNNAGLLIAKTLGGQTNALARYGIQVDVTKDQHSRLNQILAQTETMFQQAIDTTNTVEGRSNQLNEAWGDLQETLGGLITDVAGGSDSIKDLTDAVIATDHAFQNAKDPVLDFRDAILTLVNFIPDAISTITTGMAGVVALAGSTIVRVVDKVIEAINTMSSNGVGGLNEIIAASNKFLHTKLPALQAPHIDRGFTLGLESSLLGMASDSFKYSEMFASRKPSLPSRHKNNSASENLFLDETSADGGGGGKGKKSKVKKAKEDIDKLNESIKKLVTEFPLHKYFDDLAASVDAAEKSFKNLEDRMGMADQLAAQVLTDQENWQNTVDKARELGKEFPKIVTPEVIKRIEALNPLLQESQQLIEQMKTPAEKLADQFARIGEMVNQGFLTDDQALKMISSNFEKQTEDVNDFAQAVNGAALQFGDGFMDVFITKLKGGEASFADFATSVMEDLARLIVRLTITIPLAEALSNALSGKGFKSSSGIFSLLGGLGGGVASIAGTSFSNFSSGIMNATPFHFADGGSPPVGVPSLVGERGPELFVPKSAGTIVPNHALGGGGVTVIQHFNVSPGVPEAVRREVSALMPMIKRETINAYNADTGRGGTTSRAVGRKQ